MLRNWQNAIWIDDLPFSNRLNVLWVYGQYQELYNQQIDNVNVTYSEFLPDLKEVSKNGVKLIVIDDLMEEFSRNDKASYLFTRGSHHMNISVIFIVQNFFHQSKHMRTISLNSQYLILLSNFRDQNQIDFLGKQLFKDKSKSFRQAYLDATSKPFGYLLIDLKPDTPNKYRLRTQITEEELPPSMRSKAISFAPLYYIIHD